MWQEPVGCQGTDAVRVCAPSEEEENNSIPLTLRRSLSEKRGGGVGEGSTTDLCKTLAAPSPDYLGPVCHAEAAQCFQPGTDATEQKMTEARKFPGLSGGASLLVCQGCSRVCKC